jgi:hypothetical protein
MDKINFVCEVPTDVEGMSEELPPVNLPPLLNSMIDTFTAPAPPDVIVSNLVPPDNPDQPPIADPIYPPVYFPGPPTIFTGNTPPVPPVTPTPEPASILLMTTALALMSGLAYHQKTRARA